MAPRGMCSRCGAVYRGWALLEKAEGECKQCGARLTVETQPRERDQYDAGIGAMLRGIWRQQPDQRHGAWQ